MKNNSGIYQIRNLLNNHIYIGQTHDFLKRKATHLCKLRKGSHDNSYLQNAFNKYGIENFVFEILLYCEEFELTRYEQELVNKLKPEYNMCRICVNSRKGITSKEIVFKPPKLSKKEMENKRIDDLEKEPWFQMRMEIDDYFMREIYHPKYYLNKRRGNEEKEYELIFGRKWEEDIEEDDNIE